MKNLFFFISILLTGISAIAQDTQTVISDTVVAEKDSTVIADTGATKVRILISPKKALARSAWLPGYGQFSNRQYWKVPIAAGAVGFSLERVIHYSRRKSEFEEALNIRFYDTSRTDIFKGILDNRALFDATVANQDKQRWAIFGMIFSYGMNLFDAYTSAVLKTQIKDHYPVKAAFYSALLPGLGQAYNRKYWKIPIVYAALGIAGYFIYDNNKVYNDFRKTYLMRTDNDPDTEYETDLTLTYPAQQTGELLNVARNFKIYRDYSYLAFIGLYLLNIVDAVVDGHLYNFDMSDDLSYELHPYFIPNSYGNSYSGLSLSLRF